MKSAYLIFFNIFAFITIGILLFYLQRTLITVDFLLSNRVSIFESRLFIITLFIGLIALFTTIAVRFGTFILRKYLFKGFYIKEKMHFVFNSFTMPAILTAIILLFFFGGSKRFYSFVSLVIFAAFFAINLLIAIFNTLLINRKQKVR